MPEKWSPPSLANTFFVWESLENIFVFKFIEIFFWKSLKFIFTNLRKYFFQNFYFINVANFFLTTVLVLENKKNEFYILKTEVSAQNEDFKTHFLTTRWPKIFTFFGINNSRKTDKFFSITTVFSVVIPLCTWNTTVFNTVFANWYKFLGVFWTSAYIYKSPKKIAIKFHKDLFICLHRLPWIIIFFLI